MLKCVRRYTAIQVFEDDVRRTCKTRMTGGVRGISRRSDMV